MHRAVETEAAIMALPAVAEATVIAVPDPKWQERPLASIVTWPAKYLSCEQISAPGIRVHLLADAGPHRVR